MDLKQQQRELTQIFEEYKAFFPECRLCLTGGGPVGGIVNESADYYARAFSRKLNHKDINHIHIKTNENDIIKVSVDLAGWYVIFREKHYETFESLMMNVSASFQSKFGSELNSKLMDLLNQ